MEFFREIQWKTDEEEFSMQLVAESIRTHSVTYKLLHNDFSPSLSASSGDSSCSDDEYHCVTKEISVKQEPEKPVQILKKPVQKLKKPVQKNKKTVQKPKILVRKLKNIVQKDGTPISNLFEGQHHHYLLAMETMQRNKSVILPIYTRLEQIVRGEQKLYLQHLKKMWATQYDKHNILADDANKFIMLYWKNKLKRIYLYPRSYKMLSMVPLVYAPENVNIIMEPCKVLLEMGVVPNFQTYSKVGFSICTDYSKMIMLDKTMIEEPNTLHKMQVSNDTNAEYLALQNSADIVISSSSLLCIASNVPSEVGKPWDIPVTVKKYPTIDKSSETATFHKVVYIDKVLPPTSMNRQEKNWLFHKIAIKKQMCNVRSEKSFTYPSYDDSDSESDISESETFSTGQKFSSVTKMFESIPDIKELCDDCKTYYTSKTRLNVTNSEKSEGECSSDSDNLFIDTEDNGTESNETPSNYSFKRKRNKESSTRDCTCGKNLRFENRNEDASVLVDHAKNKKFKKTPPASESNVTYRLWKLRNFHGDKDRVLLKAQSTEKDLKILVRCKMDACMCENEKKSPLCVSPKLEYQAEHGAEKMSLTDLIREWTALFFRPEASLTRVRIDAATENVMMMEQLTINDVAQQAISSYKYKIKRSVLGTFFNVFDILTSLEPGRYLLSYNARSGPFASLYRHSNSNASCKYNLYSEYEAVRPDVEIASNTIPPWIPIDTNVITPSNIQSRRIPATFVPRKHVEGEKKKQKKQKNRTKKLAKQH